jgi:hypothetical protein
MLGLHHMCQLGRASIPHEAAENRSGATAAVPDGKGTVGDESCGASRRAYGCTQVIEVDPFCLTIRRVVVLVHSE